MPLPPLHRHQLARLTREGWRRLCREPWDEAAADCLKHWARNRLPLVVTRRPPGLHEPERIAMGLPAPDRWNRRRIAMGILQDEVLYFDEFPRAEQVEELLHPSVRAGWPGLCAALKACGATARVHGSYGWQRITGLDHVRPGSDIDLWISVPDAEQADAVVKQLDEAARAGARLDGELVFERGQAVAWREWLAWRAGRVKTVLVKHIGGACLSSDPLGCGAPAAAGAAP